MWDLIIVLAIVVGLPIFAVYGFAIYIEKGSLLKSSIPSFKIVGEVDEEEWKKLDRSIIEIAKKNLQEREQKDEEG